MPLDVILMGSANKMTKRFFDIFLALIALFLLIIPLSIIVLIIKFTSPGSILYWSKRVGRRELIFEMPKFRSMRIDTPEVATHLLADPEDWLTPIGKFLRKSSLDELPQLWCILNGDMSFVGPRPALFNQTDLILLRKQFGINLMRPGLTGWAQVNGRDELSIQEKVKLDAEYLHMKSFGFDLRILLMTFINVLKKKGVSH
jgi:O-antigen biosynthesis protein WbqP